MSRSEIPPSRGTCVAASAADIQAFRADPYFAPYLQRIASVAQADTLLCNAVEVQQS